MGKYGYFDEERREFVITRPDTPRPWYNYIRNARYCGLVSNTGGGASFHIDPKHKRVLRYRYDNIPHDRPGRYVYVRDDETKRYWSATWQPVRTALKDFRYECRVGLNYQVIRARCRSIESTLTYFVAPEDDVEIWLLELKNAGRKKRRVSTFSYAELALWGAIRDLVNLDAAPACTDIVYDDGVFVHRTYNDTGTSLGTMDFVRNYCYVASSLPPAGFDGHRETFIGPYRSETNPLVVERGKSNDFFGRADYPLASFWHKHRLAPGKKLTLVYQIGLADSPDDFPALIEKYRNEETVRAALAELKSSWRERLERFQAETPSENFDAVFNTWNPYQSTMTFHLSRSISPYQMGISRGIGYRDTSQDALAPCCALPDEVAEKLVALMRNQFPDGTVYHQFFPLTGEGGDTGFWDNHLWFPLTVARYCKEAGNLAYLDHEVEFVGGEEKGSVFEHIRRAIEAGWRLRGPHGLSLVGKADWNDCLNPADERTESVFTSCLFVAAAREAALLARAAGKEEEARTFESQADEVTRLVNEVAWDGAWYRRMIFPDGTALGSASQELRAGYIFLEPQVWAVLSGVAPRERALRAMDSVKEHLATEYGVAILRDPFTEYDPAVGSVGVVTPGLKENGGAFMHVNSWVVLAEAALGRGARAFEYFSAMSPFTKNEIADIHESDPYVYNQYAAVAPFWKPGRARGPWLTGTASWSYVALGDWILGVRAELKGLRIDPCVPPGWKRFRISRAFRGAKYEIEVENPGGVEKGVRRVELDGEEIKGNLLPVLDTGTAARVKAVMG